MREIVFVVIATVILGILLWLSYISEHKRFPTMFAVALLSLLAFYLFQYGNLSSFSLKALSAEASFIREKKQEVAQDAEAIEEIRGRIEKMLAESQTGQQEIEKAKTEILSIKKQLLETIALASPPVLQLTRKETQPLDTGYKITLQFTPSKNEPLGFITFTATVDHDSDTRILDFWPSLTGGAFSSGKDSKRIQEDGKKASLSYSLISVGRPTFDLTVSGKGQIKIEGNYLKEAFSLNAE